MNVLIKLKTVVHVRASVKSQSLKEDIQTMFERLVHYQQKKPRERGRRSRIRQDISGGTLLSVLNQSNYEPTAAMWEEKKERYDGLFFHVFFSRKPSQEKVLEVRKQEFLREVLGKTWAKVFMFSNPHDTPDSVILAQMSDQQDRIFNEFHRVSEGTNTVSVGYCRSGQPKPDLGAMRDALAQLPSLATGRPPT